MDEWDEGVERDERVDFMVHAEAQRRGERGCWRVECQDEGALTTTASLHSPRLRASA